MVTVVRLGRTLPAATFTELLNEVETSLFFAPCCASQPVSRQPVSPGGRRETS